MSQVARTMSPPFTSNSTECQVMAFRFIAIQPPERIASRHGSIEIAKPCIPEMTARGLYGETTPDADDRIEAEKITPSLSALQELAKKSLPPQEWWDEDFEGL
jgi:hypothetical protein